MTKTIAKLSFLFMVICAQAQDTQYSQFYANPLYLNPAFAGTGANSRVALNQRILWPSLPKAFSSSSVSFDYHAESINSGFGILMYQDREGSASLTNSAASFIYAYDINLEKHTVIRPAVQFGYIFRGIDNSKLLFGDQIDFGLDGAPSVDPQIASIRTENYWDFGTGLLMYTAKYWLGFSAVHLGSPNISFLEDGQDRLAVRYTAHAGGRYPLGKSMWRLHGDVKSTIAPSIIYKRQGNFQQLEAGASIHMQPMVFGLYYRGIPIVDRDALIVHIGIEYNSFEFGYSFDMSVSEFNTVNGGGAHEFAIQYGWRMPINPKTQVKNRHVKCPVHL